MNGVKTKLILDIGSASVSACLATFKGKEKPVLSHAKRALLRVDSGESLGGIQTLALDAVRKVLEMVPNSPRPDSAEIVLAAPWYASEIKKTLSQSEKPLKIGHATVTHALSTQRSEDAKKVGTGRRGIESIVSQVYVNGYPTALHKVVQGTKLEINLYESEADTSFITGISEAFQHAFPHVDLSFHTFPFVSFAALRALHEEENFTVIDVGGEITDVIIAERGALSFVGSFPKGAFSFARDIGGTGSIADALSRLSLFAKGELSPEASEAFSEAFTRMAHTWNAEYGRLIAGAMSASPIPRSTFLMADKEILPWFLKVFSMRADTLPVHMVPVTPNFFENEITLGEEGVYDSFLSLETMFTGLDKGGVMNA